MENMDKAAAQKRKDALKKEMESLDEIINAREKDITDEIKTMDDVYRYNGVKESDVLPYSNPKSGKQRALNACAMLVEMVEALNEGWTPNWDDSSQYKYYGWFRMSSSGFGLHGLGYVYSGSANDVGSRLCFKSSELAKYAGEKFKKLYKEWMLI